MLDKSDFEQISKLVRYEIDDAISNFAKIIMETMASKDDLQRVENRLGDHIDSVKSHLDSVEAKVDRVQGDLRQVKEKVNHLEEIMVLPEQVKNLSERTVKLEKIHLKELAYA